MLRRILIASVLLLAITPIVQARDDRQTYKIQDVLDSADFKDKADNQVAFYFGNQPSGRIKEKLGSYVANKKTNGFNKSNENGCRWAMLSALFDLRDRALKEGGDAVINIESYYDREEIADKTMYECHTGAFVTGVALKGTVVKLVR